MPERFWRIFHEPLVRRRAVDLILLVEFTGPNAIGRARFSRLISLFQSSEQKPFDEQITSNGRLLLESVLRHVRSFTSPERLAAGGSLGNYCVSVVRYALFDQPMRLNDTQIETVLRLVGEMTTTLRQGVADILRLTE